MRVQITLIVDGGRKDVLKIFEFIKSLKGCGESGLEESFEECSPGEKCKFHLACVYAKKKMS